MRPDLDLPRVVCKYEDVFLDELPGFPPQRVVDFGIELHPSTSPISMTPHRMAPVEVDTDGTFEEGPVCIMDSLDQVFQRKTMRLVRVLWQQRGVEESTWKREDTIRATYPILFRDEGARLSCLILK